MEQRTKKEIHESTFDVQQLLINKRIFGIVMKNLRAMVAVV